jgi:inosine-uridine nucleoside N-ribohydrolase
MAGSFPEGYEFNVMKDAASSMIVFSDWPTEIILSGFEIGKKILSGLPLIHNDSIRNSPVREVFRICMAESKQDSAGRMSWDETAVLVAVNGPEPYYNLIPGHIEVEPDGKDRWLESAKGQFHLIEARPPAEAELLINELIMHQPKTNNHAGRF